MDAIRSVNNFELIEPIILKRKALLKKSKDIQGSDRLFVELDGPEWLQRQIAAHTFEEKDVRCLHKRYDAY